jgi:hypothetical protein
MQANAKVLLLLAGCIAVFAGCSVSAAPRATPVPVSPAVVIVTATSGRTFTPIATSTLAAPTLEPGTTQAPAATAVRAEVEVIRLAARSVADADATIGGVAVHWTDDGHIVCYFAPETHQSPYDATWSGFDVESRVEAPCPLTVKDVIWLPGRITPPPLPTAVPPRSSVGAVSPSGKQLIVVAREGSQNIPWFVNLINDKAVPLRPPTDCFLPGILPDDVSAVWDKAEQGILLWDSCTLQGSGYTIWHLDTQTGALSVWYKAANVYPNGLTVGGPVSPDREWVLYQDDQDHNRVATWDRSVDRAAPDGMRMAWLGSGHRLLVIAPEANAVYLFDPDSGVVSELVRFDATPGRIQFVQSDPAGRFVVFGSRQSFDDILRSDMEKGIWLLAAP